MNNLIQQRCGGGNNQQDRRECQRGGTCLFLGGSGATSRRSGRRTQRIDARGQRGNVVGVIVHTRLTLVNVDASGFEIVARRHFAGQTLEKVGRLFVVVGARFALGRGNRRKVGAVRTCSWGLGCGRRRSSGGAARGSDAASCRSGGGGGTCLGSRRDAASRSGGGGRRGALGRGCSRRRGRGRGRRCSGGWRSGGGWRLRGRRRVHDQLVHTVFRVSFAPKVNDNGAGWARIDHRLARGAHVVAHAFAHFQRRFVGLFARLAAVRACQRCCGQRTIHVGNTSLVTTKKNSSFRKKKHN